MIFSILTGVGTIDRMRKKAENTWEQTTEEATPLESIFGIGPKVLWCLPVDPLFDSYDKIMGFATAQQLLRAQRQLELVEERAVRDQQHIRATLQAYDEVDV